MGRGVPHKISRHSHPQAPTEPTAPPAPATGIDYLGLIARRHEAALARPINYSQLSLPEPDTTATDDHTGGAGEVGA